jgi:PEP-CTERM motif
MNITAPRLALAAAVTALALPAHAMLVLQGPEDFDGTGLGAVNTVLTLQSPGNSTDEVGAVRLVPGMDGDIITGDALTGASQTQTLSLASVGATSASDLRVVFNAIEPGNDANSIVLNDLRLSIFSPDGTELFNSGSLTTPLSFADTLTGAGNSGFVFALDAAQAAAAQALAFGAEFGSNLIGLYASLSDATGGPETFFVASASGGVTPPIPEPQTYALMLAGLGVVGFVAARRRRNGL